MSARTRAGNPDLGANIRKLDHLATADNRYAAGRRRPNEMNDLHSARWPETFLSSDLTFGALLQFVDTTHKWDVPTTAYEIDDMLAGQIV